MKRNIREIMNAFGGLMLVCLITCLIFLCLVLCAGCTKRVYVPQTEVRTEYVHGDTEKLLAIINSLKEQISQKESKKESLIHKEKETVTINEKGDTIFQNRFVYIHLESEERSEYERKIENLRDSISDLNERLVSVKADSIPVPYPVERELTRWERTKMDFGGFALGGLCAAALTVVVVWLIKIKRRK